MAEETAGSALEVILDWRLAGKERAQIQSSSPLGEKEKEKPEVLGPSTVDLVCLLKELGQAGGRRMSEGGERCFTCAWEGLKQGKEVREYRARVLQLEFCPPAVNSVTNWSN